MRGALRSVAGLVQVRVHLEDEAGILPVVVGWLRWPLGDPRPALDLGDLRRIEVGGHPALRDRAQRVHRLLVVLVPEVYIALDEDAIAGDLVRSPRGPVAEEAHAAEEGFVVGPAGLEVGDPLLQRGDPVGRHVDLALRQPRARHRDHADRFPQTVRLGQEGGIRLLHGRIAKPIPEHVVGRRDSDRRRVHQGGRHAEPSESAPKVNAASLLLVEEVADASHHLHDAPPAQQGLRLPPSLVHAPVVLLAHRRRSLSRRR